VAQGRAQDPAELVKVREGWVLELAGSATVRAVRLEAQLVPARLHQRAA
jgi:hypothetical protein